MIYPLPHRTGARPPLSYLTPGNLSAILLTMNKTAYNHQLLQDRVNGDRRINVRRLCRELGISKTHFYNVIQGRKYVTAETLRGIVGKLGLTEEEVLQPSSENNS